MSIQGGLPAQFQNKIIYGMPRAVRGKHHFFLSGLKSRASSSDASPINASNFFAISGRSFLYLVHVA